VVFFVEGEGGIGEWSVTGVQTCALPICGCVRGPGRPLTGRGAGAGLLRRATGRLPETASGLLPRRAAAQRHGQGAAPGTRQPGRSEERRVGKEGGGWRAAESCRAERQAR